MLFNDGPEAAPFMVSVDSDGVRGGRGQGGTGGGDEQGKSESNTKEQLPFGVRFFTFRGKREWKWTGVVVVLFFLARSERSVIDRAQRALVKRAC